MPGSEDYPNNLVIAHISQLNLGLTKITENESLEKDSKSNKVMQTIVGHESATASTDHSANDDKKLSKFSGLIDCSKIIGNDFQEYCIEGKKGTVTMDNFITEFLPAYIVEPRSKNLEALSEGLSLNGESLNFLSPQCSIFSNLCVSEIRNYNLMNERINKDQRHP